MLEIDDIHRKLTPNFKLAEFLHEGNTQGLTSVILQNLWATAKMLEIVRQIVGNRPIHIDSGFRTPEHNKEVGGVADSQHLYGKAADIKVQGMTPPEVQHELRFWAGGMGCYNEWTHLDILTTPPKRRWSGP